MVFPVSQTQLVVTGEGSSFLNSFREKPTTIFIQENQKCISYKVSLMTSIAAFKQELVDKRLFSPEKQEIWFGGRVLSKGESLLSSCRICRDSTLCIKAQRPSSDRIERRPLNLRAFFPEPQPQLAKFTPVFTACHLASSAEVAADPAFRESLLPKVSRAPCLEQSFKRKSQTIESEQSLQQVSVLQMGEINGRFLTASDTGQYIVRVRSSLITGEYGEYFDDSYVPFKDEEKIFFNLKLLQVNADGTLLIAESEKEDSYICSYSNDGQWLPSQEFIEQLTSLGKELFSRLHRDFFEDFQ